MSITSLGTKPLHYEVLGRGEPMLFIHGWFGSWRYWWASMQQVAGIHRAFAIDLWGFGDSMKAADLYRLQAYTALIGDFKKQMGISQPMTMVGHGLGAIVALCYARENPGAVRKLLTVALPLRGRDIDPRLAGANTASDTGRLLEKVCSHPEVQVEMHKMDRAVPARLAGDLAEIDLADAVAQLSCPLLLTYGAQDSVVRPPGSGSPRLDDPAANRIFISFDPAGHFPMLEAPEQFNRLLLEFAQVEWHGMSTLAIKDHWRRRTH